LEVLETDPSAERYHASDLQLIKTRYGLSEAQLFSLENSRHAFMGYIKNSLNPRSVTRKILAAFLLAFIAVVLAQSISRYSFRELLGTVEDLSAPNEKLNILNSVFQEITTLDQTQRAEAITNPYKPYNSFLDQSSNLNSLIDSLTKMPWDTSQLSRLTKMKDVLSERNKLFFSYLKVKAEILNNRQFSVQLDTLASILTNDGMAIDSNVITTERKTITTYLPDTNRIKKKEHRSFLRQLFSNKKKEEPMDTPQIKVEEHLSVEVDTLAVARQNDALIEVEKIMRELEMDQRNQRKRLERQELELIHANSLFINQLLNILHDVENEELLRMRQTNNHAVFVMNQSISRTNLLLLSFLLAAAFLVYLIYIDVTRSNYYKAQLEKAKDRAEELSQIKQRFLANMSHEIRTPLQSIIGFAEQLKQSGKNQEEAAEAIHSSSEHLLHIVNEVLDYSRISSGNFTLEKERFRLLKLVKEVESAMRMQAEKKNLSFILDSEKASEYVLLGDSFRLRQILYNLLGNAIKFTNRGFIKLSVRTSEEGDQVRCTFEITDTGIGMFPEELQRIFNQFEQANTHIAKHYGGTGLGLTIVKSLIDAQHGTLDVTSKAGFGSTFQVGLTFEKCNAVAGEERHRERTTMDKRFEGKVMVVDDDPLILRLCSLILDKNGIDHVTFQDPDQCLALPADKKITHVFLDIRMPSINGVELCHALKEKYGNSIHFIALTAHVLKEERDSILSEGFHTILSKPFHESELLDTIRTTGLKLPPAAGLPDLTALREMTLNDESLFQSVLTQFVEETSEDIKVLKGLLRANEESRLREVVHRLSGRLSQLGISSLGTQFHAMESIIVSGKPFAEFSDELKNNLNKLEDMIVKLRLTTPEHLN
jgi:signal transduction histidine kinase/DNA-binding response OmpR family regulator